MDELRARAAEIRILTAMIAKLAAQDLERRLEAGGIDVSAPQLAVLRRLRYGSTTISALSADMLLAPASLVPVVDALERKGLVRRGTDRADRRRKSLALTPSGLALLGHLPALPEEDSIVQCLAAMQPEQITQLSGLLCDLASAMVGDSALVARALAASPAAEPGGRYTAPAAVCTMARSETEPSPVYAGHMVE